jgi:hypothetical protein
MRDERSVVVEDVAEEPRLEELSDDDLEAVAGGLNKVAFIAVCVSGPGRAPFCSY